MSACGLCQTEETEIKNTNSGKEKLTKKQVTNETMDNMKNQDAQANVVENKRNQPTLAAEDEEKKVEQPRKTNRLALREVTNNFQKEGIPDFWIDRIQMQNAYSLKEKGWKVQVKWQDSSIEGAGTGCFVQEDVKKGQLVRAATTGKNLIRFRDKSELPKNMSSVTKNYISNYCAQVDDFVMIFLPGNCFNHSSDPNIDMLIADEKTLHMVACKDMKAGEEIFQDYYTFGEPPEYLKELAKNEKMELVFTGYNAYL